MWQQGEDRGIGARTGQGARTEALARERRHWREDGACPVPTMDEPGETLPKYSRGDPIGVSLRLIMAPIEDGARRQGRRLWREDGGFGARTGQAPSLLYLAYCEGHRDATLRA